MQYLLSKLKIRGCFIILIRTVLPRKKKRKEILKITAKISIDFRLVKIKENMPASSWKPADLVRASSKFISPISKKRQIAIENVSQEI